jgi:hypothetical protein
MSSSRSPIRSLARTAEAWSSEPVRRALITRSISSALPDMDSRLSSFMRSALLTPSATSKRQGRSSSWHRVHRGLAPSHCTRFSRWPRASQKQICRSLPSPCPLDTARRRRQWPGASSLHPVAGVAGRARLKLGRWAATARPVPWAVSCLPRSRSSAKESFPRFVVKHRACVRACLCVPGAVLEASRSQRHVIEYMRRSSMPLSQ